MSNQQPMNNQNNSDEIDLGQLFQMIKSGLNKIFIGFLRVFLYFKRNFVVLAVLGIIGLAAGFGLSKITTRLKKTEIIVKPNFESKDYLYGIVNELQSKIQGKDTLFFFKLNIDLKEIKGFKIEITPVQSNTKSNLEEDLKYIEYLGDLKEDSSIKQIIKNAVLASSYVNYKISFYFKEAGLGQDAAKKIMKYINANTYFVGLKEIFLDNASQRINENKVLIKQVDVLITNYSKALRTKSDQSTGDGMVLLGGEQGLDIPELLNLKKGLIQSIATSKLEIKEQQQIVKILNFGQPQEVEKRFSNHGIILIPTVLIGLFFLWSLLKYLNKKALQLS
ncbi:MAG: hypothetical protein V3U92_04755 [Cellulophaga sp.]